MSALAREDFLTRRRVGLGGSDIAAVLGVSPWSTPLDIYNDKLGLVASKPQNAAMQRGTALEPYVRQLFQQRHPEWSVQTVEQQAHPTMPWFVGNFDAEIHGDGRGVGILETKCPGLFKFAKVEREGVDAEYICQMQHYLMVRGASWGVFAIFSAEKWDYLEVEVARDVELIGKIETLGTKFWFDHVAPKVPPSLGTGEPAVLVANIGSQIIDRTSDQLFAEAVRVYQQARVAKGEAEEEFELAREAVRRCAGGYGRYTVGDAQVQYRQTAGRRSMDMAALRKAHPEIKYETFEKVGAPSETIVVNFKDEDK